MEEQGGDGEESGAKYALKKMICQDQEAKERSTPWTACIGGWRAVEARHFARASRGARRSLGPSGDIG